MNYLTEILAFYDWTETNSVDSSQICLWHALMHVANKTGWQEEFTVPMSTLEFKTGLKKSAIYTARNALKQLGRIDFKERSGNQCAVYRLFPFNGGKPYTNPTQSQDKVEANPTQTLPLNKLNKTKLNKTIYKKENIQKEKSVCVFFEKLWSAYPRKQGKQSVTQKSMSDINAIGLDKMLGAITAYKRYIADNEIEERYVKMGSTFFNGGYLDYLDDKEDEVLTDPNHKGWEDIKHMTDQEMLDLI